MGGRRRGHRHKADDRFTLQRYDDPLDPKYDKPRSLMLIILGGLLIVAVLVLVLA